jgi:hypothetical protein
MSFYSYVGTMCDKRYVVCDNANSEVQDKVLVQNVGESLSATQFSEL